MAISQPAFDDALNSPGHSLQHRQISADTSAPVKTLTVDSAGRVCNTFIVEPNGTLTTIDAAMNLCSPGDTVLVAEGTYTETVTFDDDNITLKALGSAENTIITQAAATVVNMGTKSGCTIDGFTISVTAADGNTDYCITSSNDATPSTTFSDANTIQNCIVSWASSTALHVARSIQISDGDIIIKNNRITHTNTYADTGNSSTYCVMLAVATGNRWIENNVITVTNSGTGATGEDVGIYHLFAGTSYIYNNIITVISAHITSFAVRGISIEGGATSISYIIGNTVTATCSSTAACSGIRVIDSVYGYVLGNFVNATTSDTDATWTNTGGTGVYLTGNIAIGDCAYTGAGTVFAFGNLIKTDMVYGDGDDPATSGVDRMANGFCIGTDALNSVIDDATHGNGVTAIYIGNAAIDATFTGAHYYERGDTDLVTGELVSFKADKIFRTITAKDPDAIGIYWGVTNNKDSMGNICNAYSVAALGDSYDRHDRWPLNGAYVTKDAGNIKVGDLLCASSRHGYLEKQADDIVHSYTVAKAMQDINTDTQTAYIYFL